MSEYPRVLVVGQPFDRVSGGGITLNNLFQGWPKERLAAAVISAEHLEFDVCERYYALGSSEITWSWPLSLVPRAETPASAQVSRPPAVEPGATGQVRRPRRSKQAFYAGIERLGLEHVLRHIHLSYELRSWIADFEPDLIYSQLASLPIMTLVSEVLDETRLPFALHVMDDWPGNLYRRGALAVIARGRANRALASLLERADARMAISDAMASEYAGRYSGKWLALHNPVDLARWDALVSKHEYTPGGDVAPDALRVVYAGRVGPDNAQSLQDVAEVVSDMARRGSSITLQVNTKDIGTPAVSRIAALSSVTATRAGEYELVPGLLASADVLLLPVGYDAASLRLMRLSMPTKVSEYLAAGRPVLTYAPASSAVARYASEGEWSLVVTERDAGQLETALAMLLADEELRKAMGEKGRELARARHEASSVRHLFAGALAEAAGKHAQPPI